MANCFEFMIVEVLDFCFFIFNVVGKEEKGEGKRGGGG